MTFTLRPYQREAVDRGLAFLRTPPRRRGKPAHGLIVAPTGSGKSLYIASIATALDAPCLVFQPSKEILEQNLEKLRAYGYEPAVYSASMNRKQVGAITLATIGSVRKRADIFSDARYAIIDECHLVNAKTGVYRDFFATLGHLRLLGLTATPYRLSTDGYGGSILKFLTRTRPRVFSDIVHYVQTGDLFRQGYLSPLQYHEVRGFNRAKVKANSTGAEYTDDSVQRHFEEIGFASRVQAVVERLIAIGRRGILVFTRFVDEAQRLVDRIPGAAIVTAETPPAERLRILADFKAGRIQTVCNVGVLAVGFDYPELDTVVLARPTMSLALYYQMVGRAVRPHPLKPHAMIVDMVGLVELFGKVEDLRLCPGGKTGKAWYVASGKRPLTNIYFGEVYQRPTEQPRVTS